jgi:hypothetical protein
VEDAVQANEADSVLLVEVVPSAGVRGGGHRRVYYPQLSVEKLPVEEPKPETYILEVSDALQDQVADDVVITETVYFTLTAPDAVISRTEKGNAINFTQRRRRRFIEEDEILMLAA